MSVYYFAYGSNLNKKEMLERCPDSKPEFVVTLSNYQLVFAGWSRKICKATFTSPSERERKYQCNDEGGFRGQTRMTLN